MRIGLIEDDSIVNALIAEYLQERGYTMTAYGDAESFDTQKRYDLLIIDINLPLQDGLSFLKGLRDNGDYTPAIVITAYPETKVMKQSFHMGCDDYLKKPFELEELEIRIEHLLAKFGSDQCLVIGADITLDKRTCTLIFGDRSESITPKEAEILYFLAQRKGRVVPHEELVGSLWEYDRIPSDATLRGYIKNLRKLLGKTSIETIRGIGYRYGAL